MKTGTKQKNTSNLSTFRIGVAAILISIILLSGVAFIVYHLHNFVLPSSELYPETPSAGLGRLQKTWQMPVSVELAGSVQTTQSWVLRAYESDTHILQFATPEGLDVTDGVLGTVYIFSPSTEPDNTINISITPAERPPSTLNLDADTGTIAQSYIDYYLRSTAYFGDLQPIVTSAATTKLYNLPGVVYHLYLDTELSVTPRGITVYIFPQNSERSLVIIDRSINKDISERIISRIFLQERGKK